MTLNLENLKQKYKVFFQNEERLELIINEVIFGYAEIKEFIEKKNIKSILEVGCGTGILLCELKKNYPHISANGLEPFGHGHITHKEVIGKINNQEINIINKEIEGYNTSEKFDLIFSINSLEHVNDWKKYLLNTYKLLNKDGLSVILCPNYDFPYESHYIIPVIINKNITKIIFNKRIKKYENKHNFINLWESINFISKRKIKKFLIAKKYNFYFDNSVNDRMLNRLSYDKAFKSRQRLVGFLASISKYFFLDKFIFNFLKIPFPYIKLIIKK